MVSLPPDDEGCSLQLPSDDDGEPDPCCEPQVTLPSEDDGEPDPSAGEALLPGDDDGPGACVKSGPMACGCSRGCTQKQHVCAAAIPNRGLLRKLKSRESNELLNTMINASRTRTRSIHKKTK